MTDADLNALIQAMKPIEADHAREEKPPKWTEVEVAGIFHSAEVDRLVSGSVPRTDPEIERLLKIAAEESPMDDAEVNRLSKIAAQEAPKTD